MHTEVDDQFVTEPKNIADVFADHLKTIFNESYLTVTLPYFATTDIFTDEVYLS
jgi:hypothetical protein